jgi:ATP-dependent Clp protease ATP-binding subunit ClpC
VVDAPNKDQTLEILKQSKDKYEDYHKVIYSDEILNLCVNLADRYITDREFPDKAFDILDEVGAKSQIEIKMPEAIEKLKEQAAEIKRLKQNVVKQQDYEQAAELRDRERKIISKLDEEKKKFEGEMNLHKKVIIPELVLEVVSNMTKIPVNKLNLDDKNSLLSLETDLSQSVIGQSEAVTKIAKAIRRNRLGIKDPNRPIGSFIFLGSTGVGKTHLAKQLARQVFGSPDALIRIDMSEYQEKHTISKLIGSPPGYVGHDEGGQLTEQVKNKPYSVILFDEVEKANKEIFNTLLQMLDEGHLTDSLGRKINFKNTLIIMTTNLGAKKVQEFGTGIGFSTSTSSKSMIDERKKDIITKELKNFFSPEFLNRVDEMVVFNSLNHEDIVKIVDVEMNKLISRLLEMKYKFTYDTSIVEHISKVGYDEQYGARPLKRAIQDEIEDLISEEVLKGSVKENSKYKLTIKDDRVTITKGR